jgi:FeS assembly SUF system protein
MSESPIDRITSNIRLAEIVEVLKTIYDPEVPVNIFDLGLIYDVALDDDGSVRIDMTLTSPACPVAGTLPPQVEAEVKALDSVSNCTVEVVWDPPWDPDMMSEAAKLQLDML